MTPTGMFPVDKMDQVADDFQGRISFYVEDIPSGASHGYNPDRRYPTASVCKVPLMIELFRQAEEGRLSLVDRRRLRNDISHHGTGVLDMLKDEPELTLYDYARLMISVSDNMATDMVMEAVGLESVNATMERLGYPNTRTNMTMSRWHYTIAGLQHLKQTPKNNEYVHRRLVAGNVDYEGLAYTDSLDNNVTTAREMAGIIAKLVLGQIVSPSASAAMMELLKSCTDRSMIPLHLHPKVIVAHKVGFTSRIKLDAGTVYLPAGPLVIAGMALAGSDGDKGAEAIAEISRLAAGALSPQSVLQQEP